MFPLWCLIAACGLIFLPLGLAAVEHFTVGSSHVEETCRRIGIYDFLNRIYRPVLNFFR